LLSDSKSSPCLLYEFWAMISVLKEQVLFVCIHFMAQVFEVINKPFNPVLKKPFSVDLRNSYPVLLDFVAHLLSFKEFSKLSLNFCCCVYSFLCSFLYVDSLLLQLNVKLLLIFSGFNKASLFLHSVSLLHSIRPFKIKLREVNFFLEISWSRSQRKRILSIWSLTWEFFLLFRVWISRCNVFHLCSSFHYESLGLSKCWLILLDDASSSEVVLWVSLNSLLELWYQLHALMDFSKLRCLRIRIHKWPWFLLSVPLLSFKLLSLRNLIEFFTLWVDWLRFLPYLIWLH